MTTKLAELAELERAATPAPWTAYRLTHHEHGGDMTSAEVGEYVANSVDKSALESGSRAFLAIIAHKDDGPADVCHVGNGPTSPANARLIEAMRNALPSLLASHARMLRVVEAARVRAQYGHHPLCQEDMDLGGPCVCGQSEVAAALADVEGE